MAKEKKPSPILEQPHYGYWPTTAEGVQLIGEEDIRRTAEQAGEKSAPRKR